MHQLVQLARVPRAADEYETSAGRRRALIGFQRDLLSNALHLRQGTIDPKDAFDPLYFLAMTLDKLSQTFLRRRVAPPAYARQPVLAWPMTVRGECLIRAAGAGNAIEQQRQGNPAPRPL